MTSHLTRILVLSSLLCSQEASGLLPISQQALVLTDRLKLAVENKTRYSSKEELEKKVSGLSQITLSYLETIEQLRNQTNVDYTAFAADGSSCMERRAARYLAEYSQDARSKLAGLKIVASDNHPFYDLFHAKSFARTVNEQQRNDEVEKERNLLLRMNETHDYVFDQVCGRSMFDELSRNAQACSYQSAPQQALFSLLKSVALADVQYYVGLQHAYASFKVFFDARHMLTESEQKQLKSQTETWHEEDILQKMTTAQRHFEDRNARSLKLFEAAMERASRVAWLCGSGEQEEEYTYTKLSKLFQKYILNEADLNEGSSCRYDCSAYQKARVYGCYDGQICDRQVACGGSIWDCGEDINSDVEICGRRRRRHGDSYEYDYMKVGSQQYGEKPNTCDNPLDVGSWLRWPYRCNYCLCTCEHSASNSDMYLNLRPVMADVDANKIVTGVTFQKVNHVVHIQIQEGKLLENGMVRYSEWKPVDNYTISDSNVSAKIDYHAISWESGRTVYLDTLAAPSSYAVTGIRFNSIDDDVRLEIHATEFDFATGELSKNNSRWIFGDDPLKDRDEVHVSNLKQNQTTILDETSQFFKFTTSSIELDAGQSAIPYLDIQPVETKPPVPLSGAGLFLKNNRGVGPTMALKVFTFDFAPNIDV